MIYNRVVSAGNTAFVGWAKEEPWHENKAFHLTCGLHQDWDVIFVRHSLHTKKIAQGLRTLVFKNWKAKKIYKA